MWRKKLTWQLLFGALAIMLLPLVVASLYTTGLYKRFYLEQLTAAGTTDGYLIAVSLRPLLASGRYGAVDSLCKRFSGDIGNKRITVILPSGRVIGDSEKDPAAMENHRYRPEIMTALQGRCGTSQRVSTTLQRQMMYVAIPIADGGEVAGVVRTSVPLMSIAAALDTFYLRIALVASIMMLVALTVSVLLARRVIQPVRELKNGAERFARGELSSKIAIPAIDEFRSLAIALNEMARQLHERIQTITRQRNEHEAILASMSEGVIAIDASERIFSVNSAAAVMFGADMAVAGAGKLLGEVIRNSAIQRFAKKVLESARPVECDIALPLSGAEERFLQVHGTVLHDAENAPMGALLVASDVTRLRALENIRKEFVANVSHELRTPLTAIKGFVETLLTGALESKEDASRFLSIIAGQVERLSNLIDDLLTLAVIEREEETSTLSFEERRLVEILTAAIGDYESRAAEKKIKIGSSGDPSITARVNAALLEQAIGNLVDNAIKYSESGTSVEVNVTKKENTVTISVRDQGIGIPQEYLGRVFERFYRVDKARSRKLGGTGLGLSIAKHIVALHGGRVAVESAPGKGSTFGIILPVSKP